MGNNKAGAIVHKWKKEQEKIDEELDKEIKLPKPIKTKDGRLWIFK